MKADVTSRRLRRRRLALGAVAAATLLSAMPPARAQPGQTLARIGVLVPTPRNVVPEIALTGLRRGLFEAGLVEGRHFVLEVRWQTQTDRLPAEIAELLALPVDLLVAGTSGAAALARGQTQAIPIVMAVSGDPVAMKLVASLARPGGNVTGMSLLIPELVPRRVQLLVEAVPGLRHAGLAVDPLLPNWRQELQQHAAAAQVHGLQLTAVETDGPETFERALAGARRAGIGALVLMQSATFSTHGQRLAAAALAERLPSISGSGVGYARAGGLMHYGASIGASWHRAASFVARILAGAKPAELPVEQPSRFELGLNLRTAAALGLSLPEHLVLLADEVIR